MWISYLRQSDDHASAYAIGAALGTGALIACVAAGLRALHHRLAHRADQAPFQAFIAIVAVLAIGGQHFLRSRDGAAAVDRMVAAAEECQARDATPFGAAPAGLSLVDLSPAERAQVDQQTASMVPDQVSTNLYVFKRIVDASSVRGAAMAFPGVGSFPSELRDFEAGAIASAGATPTGEAGPGTAVMLGEGPGTVVATGANGCWGVVVMARDRTDALAFSQALLSS